MSDTEPGACPFCAWDHPGDTHSKACVIGRHVDFAHARGVAEGERRERAAVVKWLRQRLVWACAPIEAGEHTKEGA